MDDSASKLCQNEDEESSVDSKNKAEIKLKEYKKRALQETVYQYQAILQTLSVPSELKRKSAAELDESLPLIAIIQVMYQDFLKDMEICKTDLTFGTYCLNVTKYLLQESSQAELSLEMKMKSNLDSKLQAEDGCSNCSFPHNSALKAKSTYKQTTESNPTHQNLPTTERVCQNPANVVDVGVSASALESTNFAFAKNNTTTIFPITTNSNLIAAEKAAYSKEDITVFANINNTIDFSTKIISPQKNGTDLVGNAKINVCVSNDIMHKTESDLVNDSTEHNTILEIASPGLDKVSVPPAALNLTACPENFDVLYPSTTLPFTASFTSDTKFTPGAGGYWTDNFD